MGMLIANALHQGKRVDVLLHGGQISRIAAAGELARPEEVFDADGYVLLPALVDCHAHLDKTVWGMDWYVNAVGPMLTDRIDNERETRRRLAVDSRLQAARHIELSLALGVLHMRSHVDVDTTNGIEWVEGVLQARRQYRDLFTAELVAFPQSGLLRRPGTLELLDRALELGVDVVGGLDPASIDRDPAGSIDAVFALAQKHGKPVDFHLHEPAELGAFSMELIIDRTLALGMQGKVTISHALCLGAPNAAMVAGLVEKLAGADIHIVTAGQAYAATVPSVKQLAQAGVNICGGNDNIRDMWSPYGTGDILERVQLIAMRNGLRRDDELELTMSLCTNRAARLLGLADYGVEPGCRADLVLARAENLPHCIVSTPRDRVVFRGGEIIARDSKLLASRIS